MDRSFSTKNKENFQDYLVGKAMIILSEPPGVNNSYRRGGTEQDLVVLELLKEPLVPRRV